MVRLRLNTCIKSTYLASLVSIPLWCDCDSILAQRLVFPRPFQSHYGAIATIKVSPTKSPSKSFQSHYGAIATTWRSPRCKRCPSFNPTMVRLRPLRPVARARSPLVSIPLWCDCDWCAGVERTPDAQFQSHYGAIATSRSWTTSLIRTPSFQSHYGAIATQ